MEGMKPPKPKPNANKYNIGSRREGKKLVAIVLVKTSKLRCQTFHTL
jgi:hypothetical protein